MSANHFGGDGVMNPAGAAVHDGEAHGGAAGAAMMERTPLERAPSSVGAFGEQRHIVDVALSVGVVPLHAVTQWHIVDVMLLA